MCLDIYRDELPRNIFQKIFGIQPEIKPLIAKRDIVCYKIYKETDIPGVVEAPYMLTKHLVGKSQPKVEITYLGYGWLENTNDKRHIKQGYHSFISENVDSFFADKKGYITKKCIIPKGSTYYIGNHRGVRDGYVSNQLIIL